MAQLHLVPLQLIVPGPKLGRFLLQECDALFLVLNDALELLHSLALFCLRFGDALLRPD